MEDQLVHHFMQDLTPLVVVVTMTIASAWVLSLVVSAFRQRLRLRAQTDFHHRMMEKFSSAEEFMTYLQSDAGKSFFENLTSEPATPLNKILGSIQKGAILSLLGLGLFVLGNIFNVRDGGNVMLVVGVISFMIGIGFLASSVISYRLAKSWGMIAPGNTRISSQPNSVQP